MNQAPSHQVMKGMGLAALASTMWGISGTVLQLISQNLAIPAPWMLSTRTILTGTILLLISALRYGKRIFHVFHGWRSTVSVVSYAIFGLMANLLTFYYAIQRGNAAAATILQYLSPLFIVLGGIIFLHRRPFRSDLIAFGLALIGVILCITRGNLTKLAIPLDSVLWGIGSGISAAFYVVLPQKAAEDNPPLVVLGWGTMIAGILFNLLHPFWIQPPTITPTLVASVATVILFGTIGPFGLLMYATRFVTSILSVIFFHMVLTWAEILGIIIVIIAIYILQEGRRRKLD